MKIRELLRSRRGVSIVEVVIAMLVIVTISGVSLGILIRSNNVSGDGIDRYQARLFADNALSAFQYAESRDEFEGALGLTDTGTGYNYEAKYYKLHHFTVDRTERQINFYTAPKAATETSNGVTTGNLFAGFEIDDYDAVIETINTATVPEDDLTDKEKEKLQPGETLPRFESVLVTYEGKYVYEATYTQALFGWLKDERSYDENFFSLTVSDNDRTIKFHDSDVNLDLFVDPSNGQLLDKDGYVYSFEVDSTNLSVLYQKYTAKLEKSSSAIPMPDLKFSNASTLQQGLDDLLAYLEFIVSKDEFSGEAGHELKCAETFHQYETTRIYEMTDITATAADKTTVCEYEGQEHTHGLSCFSFTESGKAVTIATLNEKPAGGMEAITLASAGKPEDMKIYHSTASGLFSGNKNAYYIYYHDQWYKITSSSKKDSFQSNFKVTMTCTQPEHIHSFACGHGGKFLFEGYYYDTDPENIVLDETGMEVRFLKEILPIEYRTDEEFKDVLKRLNTTKYPGTNIYQFYESTQNVYRYSMSGERLKWVEFDYSPNGVNNGVNGKVIFSTDQGNDVESGYPVTAEKSYLSEIEDGYLAMQVKKIELNYEGKPMKVKYTFGDNSYMICTYDTGLRMLQKLMQFNETKLKKVNLELYATTHRAVSYEVQCSLGGSQTVTTTLMDCDTETAADDVKAEFALLESYIDTKSENTLSVKTVTPNGYSVTFGFADVATTMKVTYHGGMDQKMFDTVTQYMAPNKATVNYRLAGRDDLPYQVTFNFEGGLSMRADGMFDTVVGYLDTLELKGVTLKEDAGKSKGAKVSALYEMQDMEVYILYKDDATLFSQLKNRLKPDCMELTYAENGSDIISYFYRNNNQTFTYTPTGDEMDASDRELVENYLSLGILSAKLNGREATYSFDGAEADISLLVKYATDAQMYTALRHFAEPSALKLVYGATAAADHLAYTFDGNGTSTVTITGSTTLQTTDGVATAKNYFTKNITDVRFSASDSSISYTFEGGRALTVEYHDDDQVITALKGILTPKNAELSCNEGGSSLRYQFADHHGATREVTTTDASEIGAVKDYADKEITAVKLLSETKAIYTFADGNSLTVAHLSAASKADQYKVLRRLLSPVSLTLNLKENKLGYVFEKDNVQLTCYDPDGGSIAEAKKYTEKNFIAAVITGDDSATYTFEGDTMLNVIYKTARSADMYADLRKVLAPTAMLSYSSLTDAKMTYTFTAGQSVTFENTDRLEEALAHLDRVITLTDADPANKTVTYTDADGKALTVTYYSVPQFLNAVRTKLTPNGVTLHLFEQTLDYSFRYAGGSFEIKNVTDGYSIAAAYTGKKITAATILSNTSAVYTFEGGDKLTVVYPDACGNAMYQDLRKVLVPTAVKLVYYSETESDAKVSYTFTAGKTVTFENTDRQAEALAHLERAITLTAVDMTNNAKTVTYTDADGKSLTVTYYSVPQLLKSVRTKLTPIGITLDLLNEQLDYSFTYGSGKSFTIENVSKYVDPDSYQDADAYSNKKITAATIVSATSATYTFDGGDKLTVVYPAQNGNGGDLMYKDLRKVLEPSAVKLTYTKNADLSVSAKVSYTFTYGNGQTVTFTGTDRLNDAENHLDVKAAAVTFTAPRTVTFTDANGKKLTVEYAEDESLLKTLRAKMTFTGLALNYDTNGPATVSYSFKNAAGTAYTVTTTEGLNDVKTYATKKITNVELKSNLQALVTIDGDQLLTVNFNKTSQYPDAFRTLLGADKLFWERSVSKSGTVNKLTGQYEGSTATFEVDMPSWLTAGQYSLADATGVNLQSMTETEGSSGWWGQSTPATFEAKVVYSFADGKTLTVTYHAEDDYGKTKTYITGMKRTLLNDLLSALTPTYKLTYGSNGLGNATFEYVFATAGQTYTYEAELTNEVKQYYLRDVKSISFNGLTATYTYADNNKLTVVFKGYNNDMFEAIRRYMDLSEVTLNYNADGSVSNASVKFNGITTTFTGITVDSTLLAKLDTLKQNQKMSSKTFNYTGKSAVFNFSNGTKLTENYANLTQFVQSYLQWNRLTYVDLNYPSKTVKFNNASTATWSNVSATDMDQIKEAFMPDYMALDDVKSGSSGSYFNKTYYVEYQFADDNTPTMKVYYSSQSETTAEENRFKDTQQDVTYTVTFYNKKGTIKKGNETIGSNLSVTEVTNKLKALDSSFNLGNYESATIKNATYRKKGSNNNSTNTSEAALQKETSSTKYKVYFSLGGTKYYYRKSYSYFVSSSSSGTADSLANLISGVISDLSSATITLTYSIKETIPGASKEGTYGSLSKIPVFTGGSGTDGIKNWMKEAGSGEAGFFVKRETPSGYHSITELFAGKTVGTGRLPDALYANSIITGSGDFSKLFDTAGNGSGGLGNLFGDHLIPGSGKLASLFSQSENGSGGLGDLFGDHLIGGNGNLASLFSRFGNGSGKLAEALYRLLTGGSGNLSFFHRLFNHSGVLEEALFQILGEAGSGNLTDVFRILSGEGTLTGFGTLPFTGIFDGLNHRFGQNTRTPTKNGFTEEQVGGEAVASYADWSIFNRLTVGILVLDQGMKTEYRFYDDMKKAQVKLNAGEAETNNYIIQSGAIYKFELRRFMGEVAIEGGRAKVFDLAGDIVLNYPLSYIRFDSWNEQDGVSEVEAIGSWTVNNELMVPVSGKTNHYTYRGRKYTDKETGAVSYHDGLYYCVSMLAEFDAENDNMAGDVLLYNDGKKSEFRYGYGFIRLTDVNEDLLLVTYPNVNHTTFEHDVLDVDGYKMSTVAAHYVYSGCDGYNVNIVANYQTLEFRAEVVSKSDPTNIVYTLHYTKG